MGGDDDGILGIEAIYTDGNTVVVGRRAGCELSFPIDGLEGERVNRVGVFDNSRLPGDTQSTENRYFGIQVCLGHLQYVMEADIQSLPLIMAGPPRSLPSNHDWQEPSFTPPIDTLSTP